MIGREFGPEISVIIPVYNGRPYLKAAVESVLAEKLPRLEIIVVDDGSDDGSIEELAGMPVVIARSMKNEGIAFAMNRGLKLVTGKFVTFLDSDDLMAPGGLRFRVEYLNSHPDQKVVGGRPAGVIDAQGKSLAQYQHVLTPGYVAPQSISMAYFKSGGIYPLLMWLFLFERNFLRDVGMFDESLKSAHDCDYMFRVLQKTEVPIQFSPAVYRRWHEDNHSLQYGQSGKRELKDRTRDEVIQVCRRYGLKTGVDFHLWETGYRPE